MKNKYEQSYFNLYRLYRVDNSLEPNSELINSYYTITLEDRKDMLAGLILAAKYAPTVEESYKARQEYGSSGIGLENRYGDLADTYAMSIDNSFQSGGLNNNPKTEEYRGIFYQMIRPLTAEQIDESVKAILLYEAQNAPPKK